MAKDSYNFVKNEQSLTAYGEYYGGLEGYHGTTDSTYPPEPASFEITKVIWHKEWGGNIIDIDVIELLDGDAISDIEDQYLFDK